MLLLLLCRSNAAVVEIAAAVVVVLVAEHRHPIIDRVAGRRPSRPAARGSRSEVWDIMSFRLRVQ